MSEGKITPLTYAIAEGAPVRTIGLLRRLAILPVKLETHPSPPPECADTCDFGGLRHAIAEGVPRFLRDYRGYEVIVLPDELPAAAEFTRSAVADITATLRQTRDRSARPADAAVAMHLRELGAALNVDGFVLVSAERSIPTDAEFLGIGLLTLTFGMYFTGHTALDVQIYEAATGRLVWRSSLRTQGDALWGDSDMLPSPIKIVVQVLDSIEPAMPAVFARPIR
ncbi:MAG: hypothetical protein WCA09_05135 [Burkholderiales bacterium]